MVLWLLTVLYLTVSSGWMQLLVQAEESEETEYLYNETIYYQINEQSEVVIVRSRASVTEACIPAYIDDMPVTEIRNNAFQGRTRLTKVVLPETITKIGDYAFYQCTRLEEVSIPDTVSQIGWGILTGTPWMQNQPEGCILVGNRIVIGYQGSQSCVVIPEGTTAIAGHAFENCKTMMSVVIPDTVREIGALAFAGCSQLTECEIPEGVESIGAYCFHWCVALQTVRIADRVTTIGNHAFANCSSLISVSLPEGLSKIESAVFYGCQNLTRVTLPRTVTEIGSDAFYGCVSLKEVTLHSKVRFVGSDAFSGCTSLQKLVVLNESCRISETAATIPESTVLYGLRDSTAQSYAQLFERQFVYATPLRGDLNEDGVVDLTDASELLSLYAQTAANLGIPTGYQMLSGDINENRALDLEDASWILRVYARRAAGLEDETDFLEMDAG